MEVSQTLWNMWRETEGNNVPCYTDIKMIGQNCQGSAAQPESVSNEVYPEKST